MPSNTYVLLKSMEITSSGVTSVVFDNIPTTGYDDLIIKFSSRFTGSTTYEEHNIKFNNDSTSKYGRIYFTSAGTSVNVGQDAYNSSTAGIWAYNQAANIDSNIFSNYEIKVLDYNKSKVKTIRSDGALYGGSGASTFNVSYVGTYSSTAAITSVTLSTTSGFAIGSTYELYAVSSSNSTPATYPKATGGNLVTNDGTYWYHAFLTSGTFTPKSAITCDYLVVGGGGGGGMPGTRGGGGAGGFRTATSQSLTAVDYGVIVGAGGNKSSGNPSSFNSLVSAGGGQGGVSLGLSNGQNGGSGGGADYNGSGGAGNTPVTSPSQGNNGGTGTTVATAYPGGGGGGAGGTGSNGSGSVGGAGGIGSYTAISGGSTTGLGQLSGGNYYFAGGGGGGTYDSGTGGTGGTGGGGNGHYGGSTTYATSGKSSTGGGGGGSGRYTSTMTKSSSGGSGIVIIRYPMA